MGVATTARGPHGTSAGAPSGASRRVAIAVFGRLAASLFVTVAAGGPRQASAQGVDVVVLIAEESAPHREAADAATAEMNGRASILRVVVDSAIPTRVPRATVVIALGTLSFARALAMTQGAPIVAGLLPRAAYERALRNANRPLDSRGITAVYLEQPPARQIQLIRAIAPSHARVGALVSDESADAVAPLRLAAREQRVNLVVETVAGRGDIYPALKRLVEEVDVMIAIPDAGVYNSGTINNIVASAVRAQIPLFGFSPAYVRAGAIAAVYSTPAQIGRQAGEIASRAMGGAALPPPQHPRNYTVATNPTVARSLGIPLDDVASIKARLVRAEGAER